MAGAKGVEENKSDESKFDHFFVAMAKQTAQPEEGLPQMREAQVASQQAQTSMMQMMGSIFANQEQQRLTNAWVTSSITNISASSGCAIEAALAPQPIITMPPALVRLGGVATNPGVTVTPVQPNAAAATVSPTLASSAGGEGAANSPSDARKRNSKERSSAGWGAASSTMAAIFSAGGSPPRKKGLPPGHGATPSPEEMDGLDDDDDDARRDGELVDGDAQTTTAHGTAKMLQCLYADLYGNPAPTKA